MLQGILLDTSLLIEAECGRFDLEAFLSDQGSIEIVISAVTYMEMMVGVVDRQQVKKKQARLFLEQVLEAVNMISFDDAIAEVGAHLTMKLKAQGTPIPVCDLMIAATAIKYSYPLAAKSHNNNKGDHHFKYVESVDDLILMDVERYNIRADT